MKLLPKSKPKKNRFIPKHVKVIKLTSTLLLAFTMQIAVAKTEKSIVLTDKSVKNNPSVQRKVTGKVTNEKGESLPGVNIVAKGTTVSTQTDFDGKFTFEVPDNATTLVVTYIGLQDQEVTITDGLMNIVLKEVGQQMNEVIVVGYGSQNRRTLSTAVSKLDKKVLENVPYSNVTQSLQGSVTGLVVKTSSGQPGKASNVIVRGGTSIDNPSGATPLYIVDGVLRSQIDDINSLDIASLQVLKDAAATSIYGARASNGVIIVTTNTGKAGKLKVSYNVSTQNSRISKKYDFMDGGEYIRLQRLGLYNAAEIAGLSTTTGIARLGQLTGATPAGTGNNLQNNTPFATLLKSNLSAETIGTLQGKGWQEIADPLNPSNTIMYKSTDWNDVLFQDAITQSHTLGFSGGTDTGVFDLSLGYLKGDGITIFTGYQRFTSKLNASLKVADNFTINGRVLFSKSSNNQVVANSVVFNRYLGNSPTTKLYLEDGSLAPGQNNINGNPLYQMGKVKGINENNKLQMGVDGELRLAKDFTFTPSMSLYSENENDNTFQQAFLSGSSGLVDNSRPATRLSNQIYQVQYEGVFAYKKGWDQIGDFDAKLGVSKYDRTIKAFNAAGKGSPSDLAQTLDSSPIPVSVYSNNTKLVLNSVFGRLNYDYKNRYFATASFRYDGSSSLGPDNRYGFFPGISAGWNVQEEKFWVNAMPKFFSSLKLRGSYGVNGNLGTLGDFQAGGLYAGSTNGIANSYNGQSAIINSQIANPGLKWEESETVNAGFDLGFNGDKIRVIGDFYNKLTSDLLTNLTLASNSGFSTVLTNLGGLRSKGFELELQATVYNQNDWKINVGANVSHNTNTVEKLPFNGNGNNRIGGTEIWDSKSGTYKYVGGLQEGQKIGDFYAHKQLYILSTQAEADAYNLKVHDTYVTKTAGNGGNPTGKKFAGDAVFEDTDNNGIIDSRDRTYMGNMFPTFVGGFNFDATYKGFSLTVRTDYSLGATIYNEARARFLGQFQGNYGLLAESSQSWQKEGDITDVPRYRWADQTNQNNLFRSEASGAAYNTNMFQGNSRYYESGDYLCIREITFSYNFPKTIIEKAGIASLRMYVTGSNLYYFTKYTGLSPEVQGIDGGSSLGLNAAGSTGTYPVPRNIILGLNISL
ncbi:TonB-linked SusC/RagA family outer membrane protein [Flavobacterium cutihirudinis]|uniref:TonB-linked SusC/RagA family outer membrane protein n=1 Tax=Flavobacterium cutihirudinis TaxID=1265740 RepID=A0A3D9FSZ6_9FLAO|nr:TonB-dependent receptor [Flavobacterium cutihirudinis]RED23676.1 TonB-linked SusC/RagA family outer membrane protein [Flavobacterium cutihirudinis]